MLPLSLYELLPYIYLAVGALGCVLFDSELILLASVLIILAGFIILWMRIDFRRKTIDIIKIKSGDIGAKFSKLKKFTANKMHCILSNKSYIGIKERKMLIISGLPYTITMCVVCPLG